VVQADLGKKQDPVSKITRAKKKKKKNKGAGGVAQVEEHQPSKYEALNSTP
jgi:hypothetical protein